MSGIVLCWSCYGGAGAGYGYGLCRECRTVGIVECRAALAAAPVVAVAVVEAPASVHVDLDVCGMCGSFRDEHPSPACSGFLVTP